MSALDLCNRTLFYGEGLFETILYKGLTNRLKRHYKRLSDSARFLRIPCPDFGTFLSMIEKKIQEDGMDYGCYVKFCLLSKGDKRFYSYPEDYNVIVITGRPEIIKEVTLDISDYRRHSSNPLIGHKTINYLFNIIVKREAVERGYYDTIILNEKDEVTECSSSNILVYKDKRFFTPSRSSGLLWGTTIDALKERMDIIETGLRINDILNSEYIFITNSISGVVPVVRIKDMSFDIPFSILDEMNRILNEDNSV